MHRRNLFMVVAVSVLLALCALAAVLSKGDSRRLSHVQIRYLDVQGNEVSDANSAAGQTVSPADLLVDVRLLAAGDSERALLLLFDGHGQQLGNAAALEPDGHGLRTVVSLRLLPALSAVTRGVLLIGRPDTLAPIAQSARAPISFEQAILLAKQSRVRLLQVELRVPGAVRRYDATVLTTAEQRLSHGDFAAAQALVDSLAGTLPPSETARAAVVAAEAAFGYGRTALARHIAHAALASRAGSTELRARLQRVEVAAIAEGSESTEPPREREDLQRSAQERPDLLERVLDAALDLRLALLHDRFSREPPRAQSSASEVLRLAKLVQPERRLIGLAASLCRAVEKAANPDQPYAADVLGMASALAHDSANKAAIAGCAIASGDLFRKRSQWNEAEAAFAAALNALADQNLPREQREAWYSAAALAARRNDFSTAFADAQRAARWVGRLLALETDMAAREQLLVNTVGYYGVAERFGALAGRASAAIAVAEAGKGNALSALIRGTSRIDGGSLSPVAAQTRALDDDFDQETRRISELAQSLPATDAAISYTMLGMNTARRFELAIGVLTREGTTATLVEQPDGFLDDAVALARAVEQNDESAARTIGARLYATLVAPVAERLAGKERLFLSPHLRLHTLPWNALYDGTDFLVHRFAFSRSLPLLLREVPGHGDAPVFDHGARKRWVLALNPRHVEHEALPGFDALGSQLRRRIPEAKVLASTEATAERLTTELRRADVMLFAGHANYDAANPLRSALFTATSTKEARSSPWPSDRLEAQTLLRLQQRLDLAILLGCETARLWRGKSSYGDENVGLGRAFLVAGARHVVGALWPVLDRDAEDFLRAFVSIEGAQDVVRHAQRAARCLAERRCENNGIASWASFVVESH